MLLIKEICRMLEKELQDKESVVLTETSEKCP
jgi:hypothetical protein